MAGLIEEYSKIKDSDEKKDIKECDRILTKFFGYADKIILGIIFSPAYNFWKYTDDKEDLVQEARYAILLSLSKNQWTVERGSIFNFFSTVTSNNLRNYTGKISKIKKRHVFKEVTEACGNMSYIHNYEDSFIIDEVFELLAEFLKDKKTSEELLKLLKQFYEVNLGKKFIKKDFIEFCGAYGYSPATVNSFFLILKRITYQRDLKYVQIKDILEDIFA